MIPSASAPMLATRPPSLLGSPRPSSKNGTRTDFFDFPLEQPAAGSRLHSRRSSKHSELSAISQPPDRLGSTGVHAYSAPASTLKSTGVSFGTAKRNPLFAGNGPPVHAYSGCKSTLRTSGASAFGLEALKSMALPDKCPVHSYTAPSSTLKSSGATAFGQEKQRQAPTPCCAIHSYGGVEDRTNRHYPAAATFGKAEARPPSRGAVAVHAYEGATSTLRRTSASFGRMPSRGELMATLPMTSTGLVPMPMYSRPMSAAPALLGGRREMMRTSISSAGLLTRPPTAPARAGSAPRHRHAPAAAARPSTAGARPQLPRSTKVKVSRKDGRTAEVLIFDEVAQELASDNKENTPPKHPTPAPDPATAAPIALTIEPPSPADGVTAAAEEEAAAAAVLVLSSKGKAEDGDASPTSVTASPMPRGLRAKMDHAVAMASPAA